MSRNLNQTTQLPSIQVSISSTVFVCIFHSKVLFSSHFLATKSTFVQKPRSKNVDEIDSRPGLEFWFGHSHSGRRGPSRPSRLLLRRPFRRLRLLRRRVTSEEVQRGPGVNFINIP